MSIEKPPWESTAAEILSFWVNDVAPVKVAAVQRMDQRFCGRDVGRNRNIVHITQTEQVCFVWFVWFCGDRVTEEEQQVDLIAGDACGDLLVAAL